MITLRSDTHHCSLLIDRDGDLALLPSFFSQALSRSGMTYGQVDEEREDGSHVIRLVARSATESTQRIYLSRVRHFLDWLEEHEEEHPGTSISLATHAQAPQELLNYYLNDVLIEQQGIGETAAYQVIGALSSYYNYLWKAGLTSGLRSIFIRADRKQTARDNTKRRSAVKYLSEELRNTLYSHASTLRNECLMRCGGQLGCRTRELRGFLLNDFKFGGRTYPGIQSLLEDMNRKPEKREFEYLLQGKFSKSKHGKGGSSRSLFIPRSLLMRFDDYLRMERPACDTDAFFVNEESTNWGSPISAKRGTSVFRDTADRLLACQHNLSPDGQAIEKDHSFHHLRHSFGTDTFHRLAIEDGLDIDAIVPTSRAYLATARLLGHSVRGQKASETTAEYIYTCHIKMKAEEAEHNYDA